MTTLEQLDTEIKEIKTPNLIYKPTCDRFKTSDFKLDGEYNPIIKDKVEMVV